MFGLLARLLEFLYTIWPSYGGSIVLFTIVIMVVLAPLTFKSTRSMLAMQAMQPEMKKLQNRYKDDRQKLNEEMMKFYRENKISPLGGCLPMLIQLPVFFILYEVLYKLTVRGPFGADMGHAISCHLDGVNACTASGAYANAGFFHPAYLDASSSLYRSLSHTRTMGSFGLDLAQSAWSALGTGLGHALPFLIMVLVVIGLTYLQQQQIQSRQPKKADQNATQQMMMKFMPVAMGFIYIIIPAGVVVYFLVSSLFRIGQQSMVTRTFYTGPNAISIPDDDDDLDDGPKERKSFWGQFKPADGSLPRVGKNAKRDAITTRATETDPTDAAPKKTKPKTKKPNGVAKSAGGKTAKSQGGKSSSGAKGSAGKNASGSRAGTKNGTSKAKTSPKGNRTGSTSAPKPTSGAKSGGGKSTNGKGKRPQERPSSTAGAASPGNKDATDVAAMKPTRKAPSRAAPSRRAPQRPTKGD